MLGKNVFLYKPINRSAGDLMDELSQIVKKMRSTGGPSTPLEVALSDVQEIQDSDSLMFVADTETTTKIKDILTAIDIPIPGSQAAAGAKSSFLIYHPQFQSGDLLQNAILETGKNLVDSGLADPLFLQTINSVKWVANTNSLIFTGDPRSLERIDTLLKSMDSVTALHAAGQGYFLYKLQEASCDRVIEELKSVASKLNSTPANQRLTDAINGIECIKESNSLLITGSADAIDQVKSLIAEFDLQSGASKPTGTFLIYKAKYLPADQIQLALNTLATDLQASGLHDAALFNSIASARRVESTNSLVFSGRQETLDKIQGMLAEIDTSSALGAIQRIGSVTFFLYKIQTAAPDKLIASLKSFAENLKQSNTQDKELAQAIESVKYIKDTDSLLFTGTSQALEKLAQVIKTFDIPALQGPTPVVRAAATFVIYNPKYVSGDSLIEILCDFMDNLISSGVSDPGLFDAINNLKWIDKTASLLISGDPASVEKVQQLLVKFDIPGKGNVSPSIESIDNTSFLVYKLQFHPGNDIQTALKEVAIGMSKGASVSTALIDAINSLQWIQVTNSLLVSGQQDVLVKLKELIQNLDIPLRQVFIEILVIETTLVNIQQFGLQWGGQAQYFNKATLGTGNFPVAPAQGSTTPVTTFAPTLQGINATNTPKGGQVPFTSGFDLGVIGDIIMHKGKSFISLGALVNAIQLDNDSTILLNPKIITQDNRQSTIFVGQNVPYTGAIVTNQSNSTVSTANIEYRDVGVSLTITPILGDGDVVTMDIVQDISQLTNSQQNNTQTTQLTGIQTSHTHMETRVRVPTNHFVALSGMINDSKTHFRTAIPCLGGLPVIGVLFSENDRLAQKTNVIIFVRPQIVDTYAEYKKITEHQEWLYKDNARLPMLKEEFDEGLDLVKIPENE